MVNKDRIVKELMELVQIDSETKHERKMVDAMVKKFKELGLENVHEDDSTGVSGCEAGNVFAYLKGNVPNAPTIFFNAHVDTVVPGIGVVPSVNAEGNMVSDGSTVLGSDDKAGVAAIVEVIRVLKENNLKHGDIEFLLTVGEESGLLGARGVDPKKLKAKFGYSLDTGGKVGNIKIQAPARKTISAKLYGKTAHAGNVPEKGISAITIGAKAVVNMPLGRIDHETTANLGVFKAESPSNIVCEYAYIDGEARSFSNEKLDKQAEAMKKAIEDAAAEMGGKAEVTVKLDCQAFKLEDSDPIVKVAQKAAAKIGRECNLLVSGGASDANIFNGFGLPTAIVACGFEDVHTKGEWIPTEELAKAAEMTLAIIEEVASQ